MSYYRIYFHNTQAGCYYLSPEFEVNGEKMVPDGLDHPAEPYSWSAVLEDFEGVQNLYGFLRKLPEVMDRYHLTTPVSLPGVRIETVHDYEDMAKADRMYGVDPEGKVIFDAKKSRLF